MKKRIIWLAVGLLAMSVQAADKHDAKVPPVQTPKEWSKVSEHRLSTSSGTIKYLSRIGTLHLMDEKTGEPKASVFFAAYERTDRKGPRPVTFVFNGGPGSSSVWLHMGLMGPKRVDFPDAEAPRPAPFNIVEHRDTPLIDTDLVFIDPVGTGMSRPLGKHKLKEFLSVPDDARSVGDFIVKYLNRYQRWNSPKFIAGESYGTTRAAALVDHLTERGVSINGVVLISAILNFQTARFATGNDLPYPLFLPTYAATAWYHKAIEPQGNLEDFLQRVRRFAANEYTLALMQGDALPEDKKKALAETLAGMTGLSSTYWLQSNLRVPIFRFVKELRRRDGITVGRLDSRYVGYDRDSAGETFEFDPSYAAIQAPYTEAVNAYLRDTLGLKEEREYQILSFKVNRQWRWKDSAQGGYVNVAEDLRSAMTKNPHMKVFVAAGYFDLATPFYAAEYTMDHLSLPEQLRQNIRFDYFPAGHMMYLHKPSLKKLSKDIRAFVKDAVSN